MSRRWLAAGAVLAAVTTLFLAAPAAWAHVSIEPPVAQRGSFATFAFRVPNESATAATTKLRVQLPPEHPMASVQVRPVPGWTATMTREAPASGEGNQTETVSEITWEGGRIEPGEYQSFEVTLGPLPDTGDVLYFPAIQTYDDGSESTWIELPAADGAEPEEPAPELELVNEATAGSRDQHGDTVTSGSGGGETVAAPTSTSTSSDATTIASISLGVAVVSLAAAAVAIVLLVRARSRGPEGT